MREINELIEQIGRERLEFLSKAENLPELQKLAQFALAVLDAQEKPRGWLTWHAVPPTWSDPGGSGEYLAFYETKPERPSDDGTDAWPVFDTPPAASVPALKPDREAFIVWVKENFGECVDTRLALNGDGNDWMGWDMGCMWRVWRHLTTQPAASVPDGYRLVPVEPTWDMLSADGCKEHPEGKKCLHHDNRRRIWVAMLAAAPAPGGEK